MPTTYAIPNGRTAFTATLYTGTGANTAIVNSTISTAGFYPDFIWQKIRNGTNWYALFDSVRGRAYGFATNDPSSQVTSSAGNDLVSFNSNGFNVGPNQNWGGLNSGNDVAWQWNAASGSNVTNTTGTVTSTVSANATAGFSVVKYTTQSIGTTGTIGHGLGVKPDMIWYKHTNEAADTIVYHSAIGATKYLDISATTAATTNGNVWNNTEPTSTVFTLGTSPSGSKPTISYCWAAVAGFSAFGSYTGNGSSDGPFVYTGFRPAFLLIKNTTDGGAYWAVWDSSRNTYNVTNNFLAPNNPQVESSSGTEMDFLSNGFKVRNTATFINTSGQTIVYAAFAENPFKYANAR